MEEKRVDFLIQKYKERKVYKVKSFTRENEFHFVYQDKNGYHCTCETQMYHPSKKCIHIRKVQHLKLRPRKIKRRKNARNNK